MNPRPIAVAVAFAVALAGCSSAGDPTPQSSEDSPGILEPTPTVDTELETTELSEEEAGTLVNRFDLNIGDCFTTYGLVSVDDEIQPTTRTLDCDEPHESEVYFQRDFPAGSEQAYPGENKVSRWADERCYREFAEFTGSVYELSDLEIGTVIPTSESWTQGLHREVTCFVFAVGGGGLQGSMGGLGL